MFIGSFKDFSSLKVFVIEYEFVNIFKNLLTITGVPR